MSHYSVASRSSAIARGLIGKGSVFPSLRSTFPVAWAACLFGGTLAASLHAEDQPQASGSNSTELSEVVVTGSATQNGSVAAGYRVGEAQVGPLGTMDIQDTPFSIHVVSSALIENLQADSASQAVRYSPTIQPVLSSNLNSDYFMIRGFIVSPFSGQGISVDGMRTFNLEIPIEDKDRIEILDGPSSFLYGMTSPGGMVNYVPKAPTDTPLATITIGDYGGDQLYTHGDFGGPLDKDGKFSYRFNTLYVDGGDTAIPGETHERYLESGVFDWKPAQDTVISINASRFYRNFDDPQAIFLIGPNLTSVPNAPEASKNYGAPYGDTKDSYNQIGAEFNTKINDIFSIRSAFRYNVGENQSLNEEDQFINNSGAYNGEIYDKGLHQTIATQGNFFLDATFDTESLEHKLTIGIQEDYVQYLNPYPDQNVTFYSSGFLSSLSNPAYPPLSDFGSINVSYGSPYRTTEDTNYRTIILADQIKVNDQWGFLLGATVATIEDADWADATGNFVPGVNQTAITPGVAVTYKPLPNLTAYASFIEGLENGGTVPTGYANANAPLAPYMAHQEEVGVKGTLGQVNLAAALFRIDQEAYTVTSDNLYTEGGTEVHQGGEFTATGKITRDWTVTGGFTLLDATLDDQQINKAGASLSGKTPDAVPEATAKLYTEYAIPPVPGLSLTGGVSYVGSEYVDPSAKHNMDTLSIPAVVTGEVGFRYQTKICDHDITLRFNVENVSGASYWTDKGDNMLYLGEPRTYVVSATLAWF